MSRYSHYDTDEERLPGGMARVGYDSDTQVYTFQDSDGSYWESAPGSQYGRLTRVGDGPSDDSADTEPFLATEPQRQMSWRHELMPLLNFGMLIGLCLLLLFWYLHWSTSSDHSPDAPEVECGLGSAPYTIHAGDTCWAIADRAGISVDDILNRNNGLDCDNLAMGSIICLPE